MPRTRTQLNFWESGPVAVTEHGLHVQQRLSDEEWTGALQSIMRMRDASTFAIGDLCLAVGDQRWKSDERVMHVVSEMSLALKSIEEYRRIARTYTPQERRELLDLARARQVGETGHFHLRWRHFHIASRFEDQPTRRGMLELAIQNAWNCDDFYAHVRRLQVAERWREQAWPEGTFGLIYCDPPWSYEHCVSNSRSIPLNQYPVMTVEQLAAMAPRVQAKAAPDCVMYMWATNPKLEEALQLLKAWGFHYRTDMVWVKDLMGMGYWARQRHESLLIATRGNPQPPQENLRPDSVIESPRAGHSEKPEEVYALLERTFPGVPRLELFARPPFREEVAEDGIAWAHWGNELIEELVAAAEQSVGDRRGILLRMTEDVA